jgi:hypothetical protein
MSKVIKSFILIILLCYLSLISFSQTDSILKILTTSGYSIPQILSKGSEQILARLEKKDRSGAKQIKDYLNSCVKNTNYVAFDTFNLPLIHYWIRDYEGLIEYFLHYDSITLADKGKIYPQNTGLYLELAWSIPEAVKPFTKLINQSGLKEEFKEVLILYLNKLAIEVDYDTDLHRQVQKFLKRYPKSSLKKFVLEHISVQEL